MAIGNEHHQILKVLEDLPLTMVHSFDLRNLFIVKCDCPWEARKGLTLAAFFVAVLGLGFNPNLFARGIIKSLCERIFWLHPTIHDLHALEIGS